MKLSAFILTACLLVGGCQSAMQANTNSNSMAAAAPNHPVIPPASAQIWQLEQGNLDGKALNLAASQEKITLFMQDDPLSGKTPINHYNAPADIRGNTLRITGPILTTRMDASPAAIRLESDYLQALQKAERYEANSDTLAIEGEGMRLEYRLQP